MSEKTLLLPEDALVKMLKSLPEEEVVELFWKTLTDIDTSPLTEEEREALEEGKKELEKGESVKWEDIK